MIREGLKFLFHFVFNYQITLMFSDNLTVKFANSLGKPKDTSWKSINESLEKRKSWFYRSRKIFNKIDLLQSNSRATSLLTCYISPQQPTHIWQIKELPNSIHYVLTQKITMCKFEFLGTAE